MSSHGYLGGTCLRFNRRLSMAEMTERIANAVCCCMPCTERDLRVAEACGSSSQLMILRSCTCHRIFKASRNRGAMFARPTRLEALEAGLASTPEVAVLGPRQFGTTTLARQLVPVQTPGDTGASMPLSGSGIGPTST